MRVHISYDAEIDAWTVKGDDCILRTEEDMAEWRRQLAECFEGKSGYLLVNLRDFDLDPALTPLYAKTVKELTYTRWTKVFRYGGESEFSDAGQRISAIDQKYPSNIFPDRASAVAALKRERETQKKT